MKIKNESYVNLEFKKQKTHIDTEDLKKIFEKVLVSCSCKMLWTHAGKGPWT